MKALKELFKNYQLESLRLKKSTAERRMRSASTSKHKIRLIKSKAVALTPSALEIRDLVGMCKSVEDYLFITFLFNANGHKHHLEIVCETLLQKLDRTQDLVKLGKQMISFGMNRGFDFIQKASETTQTVYEKILVQETMDNLNTYYTAVA